MDGNTRKTMLGFRKNEYAITGKTYKVDGKHVVLHPTEQEQRVAAILSEKYGKQ